jgi:hypothetical protein
MGFDDVQGTKVKVTDIQFSEFKFPDEHFRVEVITTFEDFSQSNLAQPGSWPSALEQLLGEVAHGFNIPAPPRVL